MNVRYQITLEDVLDHSTVIWEGNDLKRGQLEMERLRTDGPEGYDQMVVFEEVYYDEDPDDVIEYNMIDEIIWFETVEDWNKVQGG